MLRTKRNSRGPREPSAPGRRRWRSGFLKKVPSAWTRCKRCLLQLIVDLRGNLGGFVGSLRGMGHLTPERLRIGCSLTGKGEDAGGQLSTCMYRPLPTDKLDIPEDGVPVSRVASTPFDSIDNGRPWLQTVSREGCRSTTQPSDGAITPIQKLGELTAGKHLRWRKPSDSIGPFSIEDHDVCVGKPGNRVSEVLGIIRTPPKMRGASTALDDKAKHSKEYRQRLSSTSQRDNRILLV